MDIKVNDSSWTSISAEDKKAIEGVIGGFFKGSRLVPDSATPAPASAAAGLLGTNPFCKAGCDVAEAAAIAACAAIGGPVAVAVCIAAAKVAGDACRSKC